MKLIFFALQTYATKQREGAANWAFARGPDAPIVRELNERADRCDVLAQQVREALPATHPAPAPQCQEQTCYRAAIDGYCDDHRDLRCIWCGEANSTIGEHGLGRCARPF